MSWRDDRQGVRVPLGEQAVGLRDHAFLITMGRQGQPCRALANLCLQFTRGGRVVDRRGSVQFQVADVDDTGCAQLPEALRV